MPARRRRARGLCLVLLTVIATVIGAPAGALPEGFVDELVVRIGAPTSFDFLPDGRMLVTTQGGEVRIVEDGELSPLPALDLGPQVCSDFERGLLGVAVDPGFVTNRFIYLYYTFNAHGVCSRDTPATDPHNRVVRYVLGTDDRAAPSTERILIDELPSRGGNHNAGDLQFGKDGMLYVSVGDGGRDYAGSGSGANNDASRDPHVLLGKVLRITPEGAAPQDNPFATRSDADACALNGMTSPGRLCRETFLSGFRNPFRMAFDPNADGVRFYVNDVGHTAYEEVDEAVPGADYGWNYCEGLHDNGGRPGSMDCAAPPLTPPVHEYAHTSGCASITGGAFVPNGTWPREYDGAYIYGDYVCGRMFLLRQTADGLRRSDFATGLGSSSAVTLGFGPAEGTQALYYTTYADGGEIRRVRYANSANRSPQVVLDVSPTSGPLPLAVTVDTSASTDPDGDAVSFEYDFGDGSPLLATPDTEVRHTYQTEGVYTAAVVGIDSQGARSQPASFRISAGNDAPDVEIASPTMEDRFVVGQRVVLRGNATDPEDGAVPPESLSWSVALQHNTHEHPFVPPTIGSEVTFTAPPPEDLSAVATSSLLVTLTASDSEGIQSSRTRSLHPRIVNLQFATEPTGLTLEVEGTTFDDPATVPSWECDRLDVSAPDQQVEDSSYGFRSWSDGGAQRHQIVTPGEPTTYTAAFRRQGGTPPPDGASPETRTAERVGGPSRITTAIALSQERFSACPGTAGAALAEAVVLARADEYPDALAGGPLAATLGAPVLLTGPDELDPETAAEIERLGAGRAVLLGGVAALAEDIADDLRGRGLAVERIAGNDRFDTARLIAAALPPSDQAYVVEGANSNPDRGWPDAVSASWLAARQGAPILLTNRAALPPTTRRALMERQVDRATVVGGVAAVSDDVVVSVSQAVLAVERVAGATRYETSRLLAERAGSLEGVTAVLATGTAFPDALAAGPSAAARAGVLLLLNGDELDESPPARAWLAQNGPDLGGVVLVGQEAAINTGVENEVRTLLNPAP